MIPETNHSKLQDLIQYGYPFRFSRYFEDGIDLYKKNIGGFTGFTALFFLISLVLVVLPFIGMLFALLIVPPLSVGFYLVAHKLDRNEFTEFRDFFKGFDFLGQLVLMYLVMIFVFSMLTFPVLFSFFKAVFSDPDALLTSGFSSFPWWGGLFMIPVIYLAVSWRWAPFYIIFFRMGFWEAMEMSRRVIARRFWAVFLFSIAISLFGNLGSLVFFIGILFTLPVSACIDYAAFADVTGLMKGTEEDDIVQHLVD